MISPYLELPCRTEAEVRAMTDQPFSTVAPTPGSKITEVVAAVICDARSYHGRYVELAKNNPRHLVKWNVAAVAAIEAYLLFANETRKPQATTTERDRLVAVNKKMGEALAAFVSRFEETYCDGNGGFEAPPCMQRAFEMSRTALDEARKP